MSHDGPIAPRGSARGVLRAMLRKSAVSVPVGVALALIPLLGTPSLSDIALPFHPLSPHQAYGHELALARLLREGPARAWIAAADAALESPAPVPTPFASAGEFTPAADAAFGVKFSAVAGRRIVVDAAVATAPGERAFIDLFKVAPSSGRLERIGGALAGARGTGPFEVEVFEDSEFVLRLQPAIGAGGRYEVAIDTAPILTFPVQGFTTRAIQSGFGAERDGGARAHRGVDVFAPRGSPVLAAMDGWVVRVETTPVGGKVIWQQPLFGGLRLYYAHLDAQLVSSGEFVRAGQPIGRVGNTGNAITTPPHLHFGVYLRRGFGRGGAVDPYPFLR